MMKRGKFLALVLVAALALMGSAYAYWTDALNITTTATAGELNVQLVPGEGTYDPNISNGFKLVGYTGYNDFEGNASGLTPDVYPGLGQWSTGDYVGDKDNKGREFFNAIITPTANSKDLSFNVTNLYPGSGAYVRNMSIVNTGSVGAKLASVEIKDLAIVNPDGTVASQADLLKSNFEIGFKYNGQIYKRTLAEMTAATPADPFKDALAAFVLDTKINNDATTKIQYDKSILLNAFFVQLKPDLTGDQCENLKVSFKLVTNWTQHNDVAATSVIIPDGVRN